MHAISSYRGNRPTNTNTQTGAITIHCAAASPARSVITKSYLFAQIHDITVQNIFTTSHNSWAGRRGYNKQRLCI